MSKRVEIITLHTSPNYGSCLQAYATVRAFEKIGWDAEIIDYWRANNLLSAKADIFLGCFPLSVLTPVFNVVPSLKKSLIGLVKSRLKKQEAPFERFREERLTLSPLRYESYEDLEVNYPKGDVYCTGSDQVWNSVWNDGFDKAMVLSFVSGPERKISFSSSIGQEDISSVEKKEMQKALQEYSSISLREESGVELVRSLGFPQAKQVLDPTLMLTKEDWRLVASRPEHRLPEKYLLVYQLNKNDVFAGCARKISKELNLPIVALCHMPHSKMKGAMNIVLPEVVDFLGLFLGATFVLTDSFHGTAFSLNFEVPFLTIPPDRFSTRIDSILRLVGAEDRLISNPHDINGINLTDMGSLDFRAVGDRLDSERKRSFAFLEDALA